MCERQPMDSAAAIAKTVLCAISPNGSVSVRFDCLTQGSGFARHVNAAYCPVTGLPSMEAL